MTAPDRQQFVQSLFPLAQAWERRTGVPAATWLAMAASESNWGAAGNSLFGIKGSGSAGSLSSPTWEYVNGRRVNTSDSFAAYNSPNDAFAAFWNLVTTSPRYADAVSHLPDDPQGFLRGINAAGYATDPNWSRSIQSLASNTVAPMLGEAMATTKAPLQEGGTYTPGDQGTAGTTTSGTPMGPQENAYSADRWKQLVASHGGITGAVPTKYLTQRDLKNNVTRTPDLSAPLRFSFGDGSWAAATITPTGAASIADVGTALKPGPAAKASAAPKIVSDAAGNKYEEGADGTLTPVLPAGDTSSTLSAPGNQEFIPQITRHPDGTYAVDWIKNQNYRPPATTDTGQNLDDAIKQSQLLRDQLATKIQQGELDNAQAARLWTEYHTTHVTDPLNALNAAISAGNLGQTAYGNAVTAARAATENLVGPEFGAHFAAGLKTLSSGGGPVSYGPNDFTYAMPDFRAIGQAAADRVTAAFHPADAALAHISPLAAQNTGQPIPSGEALAAAVRGIGPYQGPQVAPAQPAAPAQESPYVPLSGGVPTPYVGSGMRDRG